MPLSIYSDHKPLSLEISLKYTKKKECTLTMSNCPPKYLFKEDDITKFRRALSTNECMEELTEFNQKQFNADRQGIDTATQHFVQIVKGVADRS